VVPGASSGFRMVNGLKFGLKENLKFWPSSVIAPVDFRPQMQARRIGQSEKVDGLSQKA